MANKPFPVGHTLAAADVNDLTGIYDRVSATDIVNTAAETTLYTKTITGGHLSTTRMLRLTLLCDYLNNSGGNALVTIKAKFGGTTILDTSTLSVVTSATRRPSLVTFEVANLGATNSQYGVVDGYIGTIIGTQWATYTYGGNPIATTGWAQLAGGGAAAVDTTADQAIVVTVTHGTASANISFRRHAGVLELL